jgi:tRNA nucleotidyltransferase (CCA-adding enzyme)
LISSKTYLVGGAVRDDLLGIPHRERDWVVVGSTPDLLMEQGYRQVGAAFPVFIHPETREEYALARTEKKSGRGYHGFNVDFHPGVSLEEDLERRDLTINAMARDDCGELIDPFGGHADLEARSLRHVSPAFSEDPLRVLRVARFAARLADFEFTVHPETLELMKAITDSGELGDLAAERVWAEFSDALATPRPSRFIEVLRDCGALAVLLPEVEALFGIPQDKKYHPEVDAGVHVMMAMDCAASPGGGNPAAEVVFAVLLHDLGKALSAEALLPSHRGHERAGLPLVKSVCERLKAPGDYRDLALIVCEHHLHSHRLLEMRPETVMRLIESADFLRRPQRLDGFLAACEADYRGRLGLEDRAYPQADFLRAAVSSVLAIRAGDLESEASGPQLGEALRQARIKTISELNRGQ